jgi:predicted permease
MKFLRRFFRRLASTGASRRHDERLNEEVEEHLTLLAEEYVRAGMPPVEARRRAMLKFGAIEAVKESYSAEGRLLFVESFLQDLRYALRMFAKSPGFTVVAATSLALAIGANTTIFSFAKQVLYDRLGVTHPEQVRLIGWTADSHMTQHSYWSAFNAHDAGMTSECFSYPIFRRLQAQNVSLMDIFAFKDAGVMAVVHGKGVRVEEEIVSGNAYSVLGVKPQVGRAIEPSDDGVPGTGSVAVISDSLWQREFGRSPAVLGQTIKVHQAVLTIVGVNPRGFTGAGSTMQPQDVFVPMSMERMASPFESGSGPSLLEQRGNWWLEVMGRLRPGVNDSEARASIDVALAAAVRGTMTVKAGDTLPRAVLVDGSRGLHQADMLKEPLAVLWVLVGLVLVLACANIANLLLARGAQRQREMSVRLAMGASRGRVVRQMLTESLLLAALGGTGGLAVGYLGRSLLPKLLATSWEQSGMTIHFDWLVFTFAAGVSIATGILFGLAPAWTAARSHVSSSLKEAAQTATRRRKGLGGKTLVGFQIALSTLLVIGAGMFLRTVALMKSVETGFRADHLLLMEIDPPAQRYTDSKGVAVHQSLEESIAALPGVEGVSMMNMPYIAGGMMTTDFVPENEKSTTGLQERHNDVGIRFFETMGIPIITGRGFGPQDTATSPKVGVINQALARSRFPGIDPLGKRFNTATGLKAGEILIVGVSGDTKYQDLRETPPPQFYLPYVQQSSERGMTYVIRSRMKPGALVLSLHAAVEKVDPELFMAEIRTQQEQIADTMRTEFTIAALTAGFGVLALALACVGIYGIMAYSVANRRNEIGIRLALGALPGQVRRMVLRESAWLAVAGISVGAAAALGLVRLVKSMLYGIQPNDPLTVAGGVFVLLAVALLASWIPARRAAGVQPFEALRHE